MSNPGGTGDEDIAGYKASLKMLSEEVLHLQRKLDELHATDENTLRRTYLSLRQHVDALRLEAAALEPLLQELAPELFPAELIAQELASSSKMGGGMYVSYLLLRALHMPDRVARWVRRGMLTASLILLSWRVLALPVGRLASAARDNRRRRRALARQWALVLERLQVMQDLTRWQPGGAGAGEPSAAPARVAPAGGAVEASEGEADVAPHGSRSPGFVVVSSAPGGGDSPVGAASGTSSDSLDSGSSLGVSPPPSARREGDMHAAAPGGSFSRPASAGGWGWASVHHSARAAAVGPAASGGRPSVGACVPDACGSSSVEASTEEDWERPVLPAGGPEPEGC